jgi:hypothetical protein
MPAPDDEDIERFANHVADSIRNGSLETLYTRVCAILDAAEQAHVKRSRVPRKDKSERQRPRRL